MSTLKPFAWVSTDPESVLVQITRGQDGEVNGAHIIPRVKDDPSRLRIVLDLRTRSLVAVHAVGAIPTEEEIAAAANERLLPINREIRAGLVQPSADDPATIEILEVVVCLLMRRIRLQDDTVDLVLGEIP